MFRSHLFIFTFAFTGDAHLWPISNEKTADHLPIVQVRLSPPKNPLPQVSAELGLLEHSREHVEARLLEELQCAYNATLQRAKAKIDHLLDRTMHILGSSSSFRPAGHALKTTSFLQEAHMGKGGTDGTEFALKVNLLMNPPTDPSVKGMLERIEDKRLYAEGHVFQQACQEMQGLTDIVLDELAAQLQLRSSVFVAHARSAALRPSIATPATAFLAVSKRANVRVVASDEPYPTVSQLTQDMEMRRDAAEAVGRRRILELELKLLEVENGWIRDGLREAIQRISADKIA